jgi:hypothetical protein
LAVALTCTALFAAAPAAAAPAFENYPAAERFRGKPKPANLSTDAAAQSLRDPWRDVLRREASAGPNFAGAYRLVEIGCGTGCQAVFVISAATGRIYRLKDGATYGVSFRAESRLIVVEADPIHKLPARYFVFEQGRFREVR